MRSAELVVRNRTGLHARPAALFAAAAARFVARVSMENLDRPSGVVDAKSILMVLTAGVESGHRVRLSAEGPDEAEAIAAIRQLVESGLGEEMETA